MAFISIEFLLFFVLVTLIYFCLPFKIKPIFLLAASYFFYMCWNISYGFLLLGITLITYVCGRLLATYENKHKQRNILIVGISLVLLLLFVFKYLDFAIVNINHIFSIVHMNPIVNSLNLVLPIGISFYTFQAMGYMIDVYRGSVTVEKNFLQYALFVSFFPQLVAGPIERAKNIFAQIKTKQSFDVENARNGLLLMAWGFYNKVLIADNLAKIINPIIDHYDNRLGIEVFIAVTLYGLQIYCDFAGYSYIAIGAAQVLGYKLMNNFSSPYLASSVDEFWQRWHISLTSWFRDYLYIPLGGNRKGIFKQYRNIMIVFLISGLWHGASWAFIIWGGLNGAMIILSKVKRQQVKFRLPRLLARIITFGLIDFTWLFFRASDLSEALNLLSKIICEFRVTEFSINALIEVFPDVTTVYVVILALIILFIVDTLQYNQIQVRQWVLSRKILVRWAVYLLLVFGILLFGEFGIVHEQTQFIYFQF